MIYSLSILAVISIFAPGTEADVRLKQEIVPISYIISITPNLQRMTFAGSVTIHFKNLSYCNSINIHARDIAIKSITCEQNPGQRIEILDWKENKVQEWITINFTDELLKGKYTLSISYNGRIRDDMNGFYLSSYYDKQRVRRYMAATQFEPFYARRAFPCFDEPNLKATFELIFYLENDSYNVISNTKMSIDGRDCEFCQKKGKHFKTYPRMSTYLLAWVIFEKTTFVSSPPIANGGVEYRIWARKNFESLLAHTNEIASSLIITMERYTDVMYKIDNEIEKMDQVAVPDFSAGAMENWGLVLYRESLLLIEQDYTTTADIVRIVTTMSHEFAHHWFGNRVTTEWWNSTWLNEGFACYFQNQLTGMAYPKWSMDEYMLVEVVQLAFSVDNEHSHPLTSEVYFNSNIEKMFDIVTYKKGGSILRMVDAILTPEIFQRGISRYLKVMGKYKPAVVPNDLLKIFASVQDPEQRKEACIEKVLEGWTEHSGYPLISVRVDHQQKVVHIKQAIFKKKNVVSKKVIQKYADVTWYIPLTYTTAEKKDFTSFNIAKWLTPEMSETTIPIDFQQSSWVIFNINVKGFYRVLYDDSNLKLIISQLNLRHTAIGTSNRSQLIDDTFELARKGHISFSYFIQVIQYLEKETEYTPWKTAIDCLTQVLSLLYGTPTYTKLQTMILKLLKPQLNILGYKAAETEPMLISLKRSLLLQFAAQLGEENTITKAKDVIKQLVDTGTSSEEADVLDALLCAGIRHSDGNTWHKLFKLLETPNCPTRVDDFINALACTEDASSIQYILNYYVDKKNTLVIREQDTQTFQYAMVKTPKGASETILWLLNNYQKLLGPGNTADEKSAKICKWLLYASDKVYEQSVSDNVDLLLKKMRENGIEHNCHNYYSSDKEDRKSYIATFSTLIT